MRQQGYVALVIHAAPASLGFATSTSGNVRYLTNWSVHYTSSVLLLPTDADPVLLYPFPRCMVEGPAEDRRAARERCWVKDIRPLTGFGFERRSMLRDVLEDRAVGAGRIGVIGGQEMRADLYLGLIARPSRWEFESADEIMARARMIKEPAEIELHRAAAKISGTMLYSLMHGARANGRSAADLQVELEHTGRSLGAQYAGCWLDTGPAPDHIRLQFDELRPGPLNDGDRVQAGTYVTYEGYWAHELRMGVKGRAAPELRRQFERVREVQDAGLRELRPGRSLGDVHRAMVRAMDEYGPYRYEQDPYRFRPGHGLGLQYAEPMVSDAFPDPEAPPGTQSEVRIEPGMVIELHPNFGVPGIGLVCIGDSVLVTPSGPELLTSFPRELYEI